MSQRLSSYQKMAFDVVDALEQMTTPEQVMGLLASALGKFGFNSFLVLSIPDAAATELRQIALLNGWPQGWSTLYEKEQYFRHDPMAAWALRSPKPFRWSEVPYDSERTPRSAEVMRNAADFGMKDGFAIPIVRVGSLDAITMAGERPDFESIAGRAIHMIGLFAHSTVLALIRKTDGLRGQELLTAGEREVLTWSAAGKSYWEISRILGISKATVVWRIGQACNKLNAVNKTQAVVNAIRAKQISI